MIGDRLEAWAPGSWPLAEGWTPVVAQFFEGATGRALSSFLRQRLQDGAVIYPPEPLRALSLTAPAEVRLLILGQDPYHGAGQAEGLAFSVAPGVKPPPSLNNIFKELQRDLGLPRPPNGSLLRWAEQGVLLLNTCLTVEEGQAASHAKRGWETLTDALIEQVAASASPCVYLLWGAHAQAKESLIERAAAAAKREVLILKSNHPSPLSALRPPLPFMGCGHFSQARDWLAQRGVSLSF